MYQLAPQHRAKRGWLFGQWVPDAGTGGGGAAGYEGDGAPASKVYNLAYHNLTVPKIRHDDKHTHTPFTL